MAFINENFLNLKQNYLFSDIANKVEEYKAKNPDKKIVRLGIGDVTRPLPQVCIDAMHDAVNDLSREATFKGYGPYEGYTFLRNAIADGDFKARGIDICADEIFVSDGAKSDTGNFGDIFAAANVVAITDPVYPVYLDTNIMSGREIKFIPCIEQNGFAPLPPDFHSDIIYLCSPNNPTGAVLNRDQLKAWVDYALENQAVILFDSAYERFISQDDIPHSIFEIDGAKKCAVEFRSFSKTAGFTGVRCGFTVIPRDLCVNTKNGDKANIHDLWLRRQATKFNGASYIVQCGAAAIYTPEGRSQVAKLINYYMENAKIILEGLTGAGFTCYGGVNAPYIWLKCPQGFTSWSLFDELLNNSAVVGTPGAGFGDNGEGYFRLTAFGNKEDTFEAVQRIQKGFKRTLD